MTVEYGTAEYYAEQFADFVADVQADTPSVGDALVEGFLMALADWKNYHANQVNEYNRIEQRVRTSLPM
jgi:exonuclease VII large subunit